MIRAYHIYTGEDGNSHVKRGSIMEGALVDADHTSFRETPANSSLDWHTAPVKQYVITLSGILEFVTKTGETFIINPGDVLVATDVTGTGHTWRLINDEPWRRVYIVFKEGADTHFVEEMES